MAVAKQPLKRQPVVAMFGETAAEKLLRWLNPCCGLEYEIAFECGQACNEVVVNVYATADYDTGPVAFAGILSDNANPSTVQQFTTVYSLVADTKTLLYSFTIEDMANDYTLIVYQDLEKVYTTTVPSTSCLIETTVTLNSESMGQADVTVTNGYVYILKGIVVEYSADGGLTWSFYSTFAPPPAPYSGNYLIDGPILDPGLLYRAVVENCLGENIVSNTVIGNP